MDILVGPSKKRENWEIGSPPRMPQVPGRGGHVRAELGTAGSSMASAMAGVALLVLLVFGHSLL